MNGRPLIAPASVETKILAGFIGSLVLLFVAGGLTYRTNAEFADTAQWIAHTQQVRAALGDLYATISDAEAAQRDYLLTGNPQHKREYLRLASTLDRQEDAFVRLVGDNKAQLENLSQLHPSIVHRMNSLASHVGTFERENIAAVQQAI